MRTIEVRRDAISRTRAVTEAEPHPADGQAVLRVERFSGAEPIQAAYRELLDGTLPAASALICRMSPG